MQAKLGDRIVVRGQHVGDPERAGDIVEVRGTDGAPPYVVRWADGHQDLFVPSSDAVIEAAEAVTRGRRKEKRMVSRAEAGRILTTLGAALSTPGPVAVDVDSMEMRLGSTDEVKFQLEVDA